MNLEGLWIKQSELIGLIFTLLSFWDPFLSLVRMSKRKRGIIEQFSMTILYKSYRIRQLRL